jgi:hypothetical protein
MLYIETRNVTKTRSKFILKIKATRSKNKHNLMSHLGLKIDWGAGGARLWAKNKPPSNLGKGSMHYVCLYLLRVYALLILYLLLYVSCYAFLLYILLQYP